MLFCRMYWISPNQVLAQVTQHRNINNKGKPLQTQNMPIPPKQLTQGLHQLSPSPLIYGICTFSSAQVINISIKARIVVSVSQMSDFIPEEYEVERHSGGLDRKSGFVDKKQHTVVHREERVFAQRTKGLVC